MASEAGTWKRAAMRQTRSSLNSTKRGASWIPAVDQTLSLEDVVQIGNSDQFIGQVKFIGLTQFSDGEWVGIQCQRPVGKNDGSVKGVRYFTCPEKHGVFAKASKLVRLQQVLPQEGGPGGNVKVALDGDAKVNAWMREASRQSSANLKARTLSLDGTSRRVSQLMQSPRDEFETGREQEEVRQKLATAVEDHDMEALRGILPKASMLRVEGREVENGWKMWDYEYETLKRAQEQATKRSDELQALLTSLADEVQRVHPETFQSAEELGVAEGLRLGLQHMTGQMRMTQSLLKSEQEHVQALQAQLASVHATAGSGQGEASQNASSEALLATIRDAIHDAMEPLLSQMESQLRASDQGRQQKLDDQLDEQQEAALTKIQAAQRGVMTRQSHAVPAEGRQAGRDRSNAVMKLSEVAWTDDVPVPSRYKRGAVRVAETHRRAITLTQLNELGELVETVLQAVDVQDPNPNTNLGRITPANVNLYHINDLFVMPLTKAEVCSFTEILMDGPQDPAWFVSHWWGTPFGDSLPMMNYHAQVHELPSASPYWICTFANNQHNLEELNESDLLQTPFVRAIMSPSCRGTLMLMNENAEPFRRTWCTLENFISTTNVKAKPTPYRFEVGAMVQEGQQKVGAIRVPRCPALLFDHGAGWKDSVGFKGAWFPETVARSGMKVDIATANASNEDDKRNILRLIIGETDPKKMPEPPASHERYSQVNGAVHRLFAPRAFFVYAMAGDVEEIERLLAAGLVDVSGSESRSSAGETPLFTAAIHGHVEVVKLLLDEKADPNMPKSTDGMTPAAAACAEGQYQILDMLLEAQADPNLASQEGATPLLMATQENHTKLMERLLVARADPNGAINADVTPAFIAADQNFEDALEILLEANADPNHADQKGNLPLIAAVIKDSSAVLEILLEKAADPNRTDTDGASALSWAASYANVESVQLLITAKVDINTLSGGETALDTVLALAADAASGKEKQIRAKACVEALDQAGALTSDKLGKATT
eukprot:TRINITY_DN32310_c0_g1_i1.p1 TRINITY_DN32310_c0_g1~~TRINITY_DN32310_c0_g1_i1.p1  ORF type:complete len:1005 (-),score=233.26 TRINITY_DN32310_c0_g1_i1:183-3197(-)